jgi:hypothetical protein
LAFATKRELILGKRNSFFGGQFSYSFGSLGDDHKSNVVTEKGKNQMIAELFSNLKINFIFCA